jgi:opacity protein-like surface antigen
MRTIAIGAVLLAAAAACAQAQQWEFGGLGGGAFLNDVTVTAPAGSATAGFQPGVVAGAFLGQNISNHIGGEVRYEYFQSNLELKHGGASPTFSGQAHAVHYDLLIHSHSKTSSVQFFGAVGGGVKLFRGTGTETVQQPLYQYGYFTKTQAIKPMFDVGGGVRFSIAKRLFLRVEVRDFITGFPTQVLTPPGNAKYGSILQDIVPMVGVSYAF